MCDFGFSQCKSKEELKGAVFSVVQDLTDAICESCEVSVGLACYLIRDMCAFILDECLDEAFEEKL